MVGLSDHPPCELLLVRVVRLGELVHGIRARAGSARNAVVQVVLLPMARAIVRVEVFEEVG